MTKRTLRVLAPILTLVLVGSVLMMPSAASAYTDDEQPEREFLCVYADHLHDAADAWVEYREQTGWDSRAVAISDIVDDRAWLASNDQNAAAKELQAFIQREYAEARAERQVKGGWFAVMLLGDVTVPEDDPNALHPVPTFYFEKPDDWALRSFWERDDYVTDHPYQLADDRDELPDFLIGRVPAQTHAQAMTLLSRIKTYEQHPAPGDWRKRITYLASEGGFGAIDKMLEKMFISLVESTVPYDFDVSMTYANPTSPYCAPPTKFNQYVYNRMNDGALLVNYIGHGAPNSLDSLRWGDSYYPICRSDEVTQRLTIRDGESPILLIVACSTGMFDQEGGEPSLSETMLFHDHGPIAVVAGSRVTHPYPNAFYQKDFAQQMCIERRPTIGGVDLMATRGLINIKGDAEDEQFERLASLVSASSEDWITPPAALRLIHASLYNLLGDPATAIAYPPGDVVDLAFDDSTRVLTGRVTGESMAGEVVVTVEAPRSVIARADELLPVMGRDDPDLESKAAHNYDIANNRVLDRLHTTTDPETGEFEIVIPAGSLADAPADTLWLKAAFMPRSTVEEAEGMVEAVGSLAIRVTLWNE